MIALVFSTFGVSSPPARSREGEAPAFLGTGKTVFVDNVWSGAPVGFQLATRNGKQYVAYYDAERRMTVACRDLGSGKWTYARLDEIVGWDSHNFVSLAFDSAGFIHLSGNMHCVPLVYFRTTKPEDITTFVRVRSMTGANEKHATYPRFSTGPHGEFLFSYRDGGSGNGNEIVNVYDVRTAKWKRFVAKPLFDGQGKMNAYYTGPVRDAHGIYHYAWVWRDTPDCSTNHDLSYARSRDLKDDFEKSDGTGISLPITIEKAEVVDPVPVNGGMLNNVRLSFDSADRVMVSYVKFDGEGHTQLYTARRERRGWRIYRTTEWRDRWAFSGGGTIPVQIIYDAPRVWRAGRLYQTFTNKFDSPRPQMRFLDERTLRQEGSPVMLYPADFDTPAVKHTADWQVNTTGVSLAALAETGSAWTLRWESAGPNRDRARPTVPPPSRLEVVELAVQ